MNNIEGKLDDINENLTATQKNINQIKSIFGGIKNRFVNWSSGDAKNTKLSKSETFEKSASNIPAKQQQQQQPKAEFVKITNSAREQQIGDHFDLMSDSLARINAMAKDMSGELDRQNHTIDRLGGKTLTTNERINKQNEEMKRIK